MVEKLYSEFDSDISITSVDGKTFPEDQLELNEIRKISGVKNLSRAVEEVVVLKHEKKTINAHLIGVDTNFLSMSNMNEHLVDGEVVFKMNNDDYGMIGATLLDNLGGFIPENTGYESILFYVPKRNAKVKPGGSPFNTELIKIGGRFSFNKEVNSDVVLLPLEASRKLLDYNSDISAVYIDAEQNFGNEKLKEIIQEKLGNHFQVKTNYEKNELIYKTSKSEKLIVFFILIFVFILAAFNLVASLTMLFIEKMDNIKTMISYGASKKFIFNIFFYEGLLISFQGIISGLILGYSICFLQVFGHIIKMPNSAGEDFPMVISIFDTFLIIGLVSLLSVLASYLPIKYLMKKNLNNNF